jgi:glycerol-3-phosphate acyltransferase PlsX
MKIILDAHGGDNAPKEIVIGAALAAKELGVEMILAGRTDEIQHTAQQNGIDLKQLGIEIIHAADVISMNDTPTDILKSKRGSSMAAGLSALAEGKGDAFISAGNTGALLAGGTLIVKRVKGVKRPAIATLIPSATGHHTMLIDSGANADCRPEYFVQFGLMGQIYMRDILHIKNPSVGLLNVGTEETKGTQLVLDAYQLLKQDSGINFYGNVEGRDLTSGVCDVIVTDGFTGNIALKVVEGAGSFIKQSLKSLFTANIKTKIGALLVKDGLASFKKAIDYTEHGGAPLLGLQKPVIKAHGSSNAKAIKNAVRQAKYCIEADISGKLSGLFQE